MKKQLIVLTAIFLCSTKFCTTHEVRYPHGFDKAGYEAYLSNTRTDAESAQKKLRRAIETHHKASNELDDAK